MEDLYKVIEIKEKGLGCVALKDLKKGTLILREKPQCVGVTSGHSGLKYIKNAEIFLNFGKKTCRLSAQVK